MQAASPQGRAESNSTDWRKYLEGKSILLMEDEFFIALDIQEMIEDEGAHVTMCSNLDEGFAALSGAADGFDAAVLDIRLGDRDVFPLARVLNERNVPIIFHSAHLAHLDIARDFPVAIALDKPAPSAVLLRAICRLLGAPV